MKKLLILLFLYLIVEGDNIIGDGLYVYHRGKHAVDELATKVDEYYPKVKAVDTVMTKALSEEFYTPPDSISIDSTSSSTKRSRRIIYR